MEDHRLVERARTGQSPGFTGIYDKYADRLYDHIWTVTLDEAAAADGLRATAMTAAQRLPKLKDPDQLRTWLFAIASNEALRRARNQSAPPPPEGGFAPGEVWPGLAALPPKERTVLSLRNRQKLVGADLGLALGVSAARAQKLLDTATAHAAGTPADNLAAVPPQIAPAALRREVVEDLTLGAAGGGRWPRNGYPPPVYRSSRPLVLALALLLLGGLAFAAVSFLGGDDDPTPVVARRSPRASASTSPTPTASPAGPVVALPSASATASESPSASPSTAPSASASPAPTATKSPAAAPAAVKNGHLTFSQSAVNLGGSGSTATLEIRADGGPVNWAAGTSVPGLTVSPSSGKLASGQKTAITVRIDRNRFDEGTVSEQLRMRWVGGGRDLPINARVERGPTINASGPNALCAGVSGTVTASVADESSLASVTLVWVVNGTTHTKAMSPASGKYSASLGPFTAGSQVSWYVRAADSRGNASRTNSVSLTVNSC